MRTRTRWECGKDGVLNFIRRWAESISQARLSLLSKPLSLFTGSVQASRCYHCSFRIPFERFRYDLLEQGRQVATSTKCTRSVVGLRRSASIRIPKLMHTKRQWLVEYVTRDRARSICSLYRPKLIANQVYSHEAGGRINTEDRIHAWPLLNY